MSIADKYVEKKHFKYGGEVLTKGWLSMAQINLEKLKQQHGL